MSFCLASLLNRKIEELLSFSCGIVILTLYCFGLMGQLKVGLYVVFIEAILLVVIFLFMKVHTKKLIVWKLVLTPGFTFFLLFSGFFFVALKGRMLYEWDEFTHWGLVVKNMDYFDVLGSSSVTTTWFRGYPPATALFQYFFVKLGRPFTESYLFRAIDFWIVALLASSFKNTSWEHKALIPIRFVALLFIPTIFSDRVYSSIYVDALLGIVFAHMLYSYYLEKKVDKFTFVNIGMSAGLLSLIKASGVGLAFIGLLIIGIDIVFCRRTRLKDFLQIKRNVIVTLVPIFMLAFCKISWSVNLKQNMTGEAWNTSNVTLQNIFSLFGNSIPAYRRKTINVFWANFFGVKDFGSFRISPFMISLIFLSLGFICLWGFSDLISKRQMLVLQGGLFGGYIIYTASLLILYLFTYSEYEAQQVASFDRYIGTYLLGLALTMTTIFLDYNQSRVDGKKELVSVIVLYGILLFAPIKVFVNSSVLKASNLETVEYRSQFQTSQNLGVYFYNKNSKIYFISQNSNGRDYWVNYYNLTPAKISSSVGWSLGEPYSEKDVWTKDISFAEWESALLEGGYTTVYLYKVDSKFKERYGSMFVSEDQIKSDSFYKVKKLTNGNVQLELDFLT